MQSAALYLLAGYFLTLTNSLSEPSLSEYEAVEQVLHLLPINLSLSITG